MYKNITDNELNFVGLLHDPVALKECLFPENMKAPHLWKEEDCKLFRMRNYQFSWQNYSHMLCDDKTLTKKINFDKKQLAGQCYNIGGRNSGKCEYIENFCQLASGQRTKFKDLIGTKQYIFSLNEESLKFEKDIAYFKDNGLKKCYKVILRNGQEIILTGNHPLLTDSGWKNVSNLNINEYIAKPRYLYSESNIIVHDNLAKLLGYLLGDGSCTGASSFGLTNIDPNIIEEWKQIADFYDCKTRLNDYTYYVSGKKPYYNKINKLVFKYGLNKLSKKKQIPKEVFSWKNKSIAILLNRLFACDGHIGIRDKVKVIELTLASEKMINEIQNLLLRFGVQSGVHYKKAKLNDKHFDAWRLIIAQDFDKFLDTIGVFSKDKNIRLDKKYSTSDLIPNNIINKYSDLIEKNRLKKQFSCGRKYGYSRNKLKKHITTRNIPGLFKHIDSDIYWDRIVNIECVGELQTVEVSVLKNHNYISNNIISHNSYDFIQLDIIIEMILGAGKEICCGAGTQGFLTKVLNPVLNLYRSHPFLKLFHLVGKKDGIRGGNDMEISAKHGGTFYGRSENIDKPEPGTKFHGLHYEVLIFEEFHYSSDKGEEKRIDSGSSLGIINRFSGIPDIRIGSPLGRILSDENNKSFICRYPQFVRDDWSEKIRNQRIEEYNGESNLKYKLNVIGERIEGAEGFWDIERIKDKCLNKKRTIKQFDIDKKKFPNFKHHIILDRLANEKTYVCADIGAGARPTEIIIVFYQNKKYRYEYNITLNKLTSRQQAEIFAWIYNYLGSAFIGLDATTDYGIKDYLVQDYDIPDNHVLSVDLRKNIAVGFVKDKDGKILKDNKGKDILKQKRAIDWAMERMLHFMYEGKFDIPIDNKFFKEFSGFKVIQSGTRKSYDSSTTDDLHQSFQVFCITQWDKEFETLRNKNNKQRPNCLGHF